MATRSPMEEKTRKARKLAMLEAKYVQAVGDAADYERGREVRVYDHLSTRDQIDRREKFVRERRMLTPIEDWCVAMGYAKNPFIHEGKHEHTVLTPVDFPDGSRRRAKTIEEAREWLRNGATRLWNVNEKHYEYA